MPTTGDRDRQEEHYNAQTQKDRFYRKLALILLVLIIGSLSFLLIYLMMFS